MAEVIGEGLSPDVLRSAFRNKENIRALQAKGRAHMVDLGRVSLIDSHRVLMRHGDDPQVIRKFEKDYAYLASLLTPDELDEARDQAFKAILNEKEEQ